jgi:hypothetical protein
METHLERKKMEDLARLDEMRGEKEGKMKSVAMIGR